MEIVSPEVHYPLGNVVMFCCGGVQMRYEIKGYEICMGKYVGLLPPSGQDLRCFIREI